MSIVPLSDILAAEDVMKTEGEAMKAEESESVLRRQLSPPVLEDVSPCCNASVIYPLGPGNPVCPDCGKPIYYQE